MRDAHLMHLENQGITARIALQNLLPMTPKPIVTARTPTGQISSLRIFKGINTTIDVHQLVASNFLEDDPELSWHNGGRSLEMDTMTTAYFDPQLGEKVPVSDFQFVDIVYDAKGTAIDRRTHVHRKSNINDPTPLKLGKRLPLEQALTSFVFCHTYQLVHEDGVTMDFLYRIATELHSKNVMAIVGAGAKGSQPLVLRDKGSPYRGFLYGEIGDGTQSDYYKLLLLLSAQEMKVQELQVAPES